MKILLTLDPSWFSEAVLGPATQMAAASRGVLHLLIVTTPEEAPPSIARRGGFYRSAQAQASVQPYEYGVAGTRSMAAVAERVQTLDQLQHEARSHLATVAERCYQVPVSREALLSSAPATAIEEYMVAHEVDLVAMAVHNTRGTPGRASRGSVAGAVICASRRPVLLVASNFHQIGPRKFRNMLIYVDGSACAETILPTALFWARALGLRLTIIRAARLERGSIQRAARYLDRLSLGLALAGTVVGWEVIYGDPAWAVARYAAQLPGALIAMSIHLQTGVTCSALGMVAMQTLRIATCPVLVRRPQALAPT